MDILEQLINPPAAEHIALLNIMQVIAFLIFLPFAGLLLGGIVLSVYYNRKYRKTKNVIYLKFSKDIIDKLSFSKNFGWGMGVVPVITIILIYAQFLYGVKVMSVSLFLISLVVFIASFIFIYNFKGTFQIEKIINIFENLLHINPDSLPEEVKEYEDNILKSNVRFGNWGMYLLFIAIFLFTAGFTIASSPLEWDNSDILSFILNPAVWLNFLYFITSAFAVSGAAILYFFFIWQGGIKSSDEEYKLYAKKSGIIIALVASMIQPVFLVLSFILQPMTGFTPSGFLLIGLSIVIILFVCNFLYAALRNSEIKYAGAVFFLIFVTFAFTIIQQQLAFGASIKPHLYSVTKKAEEHKKEITGKTISTTGVNAEEIYNAKCIACHKFDVKLVGPPYQETVPKYAGDVKKLSEFIYNPQKINAAYPPMPNQGLKKKEADALAQWLIQKVSGK